MPPWQFHIVLSALAKPPFEPVGSINLKWLSQKAIFLLAITSAKRIGELHALSIHPDCFHVQPEGTGVVLRPNTDFMPKILSTQNLNQAIVLDSYRPPNSEPPHGRS